MERRYLASLGAAALLVICGIVQLALFFTSDPDMLALCLEETTATVEPPEIPSPLRVAIFAPAGDESGRLEKGLRARFDDHAEWKVLDRELQEDALNESADVARRPKNDAEAVAAGRKLGVEAVLWAEAKAIRQDESKAEADFSWGLWKLSGGDKGQGERLAGGSAAKSMSKGFFALDRFRARIDHTSALFRIFFWIVGVLVLPAALAPVNELALGRRDNSAAAVLLTGYAVIDFVLMLLLNGFRLFTVFWVIAALVALVVGALYSLAVLNALSEN